MRWTLITHGRDSTPFAASSDERVILAAIAECRDRYPLDWIRIYERTHRSWGLETKKLKPKIEAIV